MKLFAISIAILSCRAVKDDKQYDQHEVDAIGSLFHVHGVGFSVSYGHVM